jgi:hypothetical protein
VHINDKKEEINARKGCKNAKCIIALSVTFGDTSPGVGGIKGRQNAAPYGNAKRRTNR